MPQTFDAIATTTVTGTATAITFNSIPSGYTDLRVLLFARQGNSGSGASSSGSATTLNNDTSTIYSACYWGSNPTGYYQGNFDSSYAYHGETPQDGNTVGVFASTWIDVNSYLSTSLWKPVTTQSYSPNTPYNAGQFGGYMFWNVNTYRQTSNAITRIDIYAAGTAGTMVFEIGSMATLYGIKAA